MASIGTRLATTFVSATCTWTANDSSWATRRDSFAFRPWRGYAHSGSACLKFAREHGAPWDEWTCALAAWYGNLECLKLRARERVSLGRGDVRVCRLEWTFGVFEVRARERVSLERGDVPRCRLNGHLECLKYAHENGCPWDERDVRDAASDGHLECLKYAHENGCPWNEGRASMPPRMDIWSV